ncbi:MAG TPA: hypothetical protein VMW16_07605 [Sedimentisphaerales bacterium]|nr:hypothetical protein [Sedimentisphaerales bacterium]
MSGDGGSDRIRTISILWAVLLSAGVSFAKYSGGTGEANDPYRIATPNDMQTIGANPGDWNKHFVEVTDISLAAYTGTQFNIIGNITTKFTGVFDGNGHTLSNFSYGPTGNNYIGLFRWIAGNVSIKRLILRDPNINGYDKVGSLVGYMESGGIVACGVSGACVMGHSYVGGLVGLVDGGILESCCYTGKVSGSGKGAGGLAGLSRGAIRDCGGMSVVVVGGDMTGGLVGTNWGTIRQSFSSGSVSGGIDAGGLVGLHGDVLYQGRIVENSYSTCTVSGDKNVGGLVGNDNLSYITKSSSTGRVSGNEYVGGLLGVNVEGAIDNACFWETESSGRNNMCGAQLYGGTGCDNAKGRSSAEMMTESTFTDAGWDFVGEVANGTEDTWRMCVDGVSYPLLSWEFTKGDLLCPDGVDLVDYSYLADRWQDSNCGNSNDCDRADVDLSGVVDWADVRIFCQHWLEGTQ